MDEVLATLEKNFGKHDLARLSREMHSQYKKTIQIPLSNQKANLLKRQAKEFKII